VIERDPFHALDKLCAALRPGGLLVISTPDAESWPSRTAGRDPQRGGRCEQGGHEHSGPERERHGAREAS